MISRAEALAVALLALLSAGCLATLVPADLDGIYDPTAAELYPDRNPVIVIPGFLGCRLVDRGSGHVVWGEVGGDFADPATPEGARVIARSMRAGVPSPDVEPDGVLSHIDLGNVSVRLKPYYKILEALGAAGYRDEDLRGHLEGSPATQHFNSFQFDYDWRLDNAANAQRLHAFVREKAAYVRANRQRRGLPPKEIRFDVIAHSMGGLLTRYYLRYGTQPLPDDGSQPELTWEGARHVERVILLATPNAGSIKAARNLIEGVKHAPGFPYYDPVLNGTFPSGYQILPRDRHGAFVDASDPTTPLAESILDPELWERLGWGLAARDKEELLGWLLPDVDPAERRAIALAYQRRMLRLAGQLQRALDRPATPPPGTELFLIASDSIPTAQTLAVDLATGAIEVVVEGKGDGSVLRTSAEMDESLGRETVPDSPIAWQDRVFISRPHSRVALDPVFADRLVYWLLESERPYPKPSP